jgi:hypothetical protein
MPLPGDITTITVTGAYLDPFGNPLSGTVVFVLPVTLQDSTGKVVLAAGPYPAVLVNGRFSITLPCTDNATVSPVNFTYTVVEQVPGVGRTTSFLLPHTLGASVDISALVPVNPAPGTSTVYGVLAQPNTWSGTNVFQAEVTVPAPVSGSDAATKTYVDTTTSPAQAWVFNPYSYGAKGDGQLVSDGAITAGQNTLACTTSTPFRSGVDVGKAVKIKGAGPAGVTTLVATITGFTDNGHVTISTNASVTVTGALVTWATDDTAAFAACQAAAISYAGSVFSANGYVRMFLPPSRYGLAGPLVNGGATKGNAQWALPIVQTGSYGLATGNKVVLDITGPDNGAPVRHWQQTVPCTSGATLLSFGVFSSIAAQTASLNANGSACVIGGPSGAYGYGTGAMPVNGNQPSVFSNMQISLRNLNIVTTHSTYGLGYGAFSFHGIANAYVENVGIGTDGTAAAGDFNNPLTFANGFSIGGIMPASGNNDSCQVKNLVVNGGYTFGLYATEHTLITGGTILFCWAGYCPVGAYGDGGSATGALHATSAPLLSLEGNTWPVAFIGAGASGVGPQVHAVLDLEQVAQQFRDQSNGTALAAAVGEIRLVGGGGPVSTTFPTGVCIINDLQLPGPAAQIPLVLGTPVQNTYWRRAKVLLAGGTVTAVKVSQLMGGAAAPAMTAVYTQASGALPLIEIPVGPGAWIEVDGSVLPTTNTWILE